MEIKISDISNQEFFKIMAGVVVPRPIAWVSTRSQDGKTNLAPFSFFTGVSSNPPTILFCPTIRGTDGGEKDTLQNIRATGEFVVNVVSRPLTEAMNLTATEVPPEVNEFEIAGLTEAPSSVVKPPRVKESPIHLECIRYQIVDVGEGDVGSASIVIGEVVHIHISDEVLLPNYRIDTRALDPVGRLAGPNYGTIGEILQIVRQTPQIDPKE